MSGFTAASKAGSWPGWVCGGTARVTCSSGPAVPCSDPRQWHCCLLCCPQAWGAALTPSLGHGSSGQRALIAQDGSVTFVLLFLYTANRFKLASAGLPDRGKSNLLINLLACKFCTQISHVQSLGFCKSFLAMVCLEGLSVYGIPFWNYNFSQMGCLKVLAFYTVFMYF